MSPRPIGWISTLGLDGAVNLAPYSFFNAVADKPPVVMFSSAGRKDSQRNAEETGAFVCNIASWDLRHEMSATSETLSADVDEMSLAGLQAAPSHIVAPPRVAAAPAALECTYIKTIGLPDGAGGAHRYSIVLGLVVGVHIRDDVINDGRVDVKAYKPIARLGYQDYSVVDDVFSIIRPDELK